MSAATPSRARTTSPGLLPAGEVALVAGGDEAARALADLPLQGRPRLLTPSPGAPFRAEYRSSLLGVVAGLELLPWALRSRRLFRLPYVALLDERAVEELPRADGRVRAALERAGVVVVPGAGLDALRAVAPGARAVEREGRDRLAVVLRDVALAPGGRGTGSPGLGAAAVGGWMALDDRLTRLAMRLVQLTGKAAAPTHPKHLVDEPWHHWYRPYLAPGDRVLDVGCANGVHALAVAPAVGAVVGVDVDAAELERARSLALRDGARNVDFVAGDLTDPETLGPERLGSFDAVLLLDVLEHLEERRPLLERLGALLRPGGRLLVAVPRVDTPYKRFRARVGAPVYMDPDHKVEYTLAELEAELAGAGFAVEHVEVGGYDTPFHGAGALVGAVSVPLFRRLSARRRRSLERRPERATALRVVATR